MTALTSLTIYDFEDDAKFHVVCKSCEFGRTFNKVHLQRELAKIRADKLWLDEVEKKLACSKCGKRNARLNPSHDHLMEGFQGGMA